MLAMQRSEASGTNPPHHVVVFINNKRQYAVQEQWPSVAGRGGDRRGSRSGPPIWRTCLSLLYELIG